MAFPTLPEYITGAYAHAYIAACGPEIQAGFQLLQARRGITIPNDSKVLCSKQLRLLMDVI